jgi:hypothetical protein
MFAMHQTTFNHNNICCALEKDVTTLAVPWPWLEKLVNNLCFKLNTTCRFLRRRKRTDAKALIVIGTLMPQRVVEKNNTD